MMFPISWLIQVMQELGLIGLRIQRMPSEPDVEFGIPSQYSYMTVRFLIFTIFTKQYWQQHYLAFISLHVCFIW